MWAKEKSFEWYKNNEWLVGCNYLPSNAINQLEMFQVETYDSTVNKRELSWAKELGFNSVRVYLHDLLWQDSDTFKKTLNDFLEICHSLDIKVMLVLFVMIAIDPIQRLVSNRYQLEEFIIQAGNKVPEWL